MIRRLIVIAVVALGAASQVAFALTDEEIYREFRFNLINPGARSLALGGAFVSLADDATAAQANPAGLAYLNRWEVFLEGRAVDNGGQLFKGSETLPTGLETFVASGTNFEDTVSPSFLSIVYPVLENRLTLALSRQEVLHTESETLSSFAFTFPESPGVFLVEGNGALDVRVDNLNFSLGYRFLEDRFAVGASFAYSQIEMRAGIENYIVDTEANLAPCEILVPTLDVRTGIDDEGDDVTFSVGAMYRPSKGNLGVGLVYRQGPDFSVQQNVDAGTSPCDGGPLDVFGIAARLGDEFENRLHLPDALGLGLHWLQDVGTKGALTLAAELDWVTYSNLMDGYVAGVNVLTSPDAEFTVDDGLEARLGLEYVFLKVPRFFGENTLIALRGGGYSESDSTIRAVSTGSNAFASTDAFAGKDTEYHLTLGTGFIWNRLKLDLAADLADSKNQYVLSLIIQGKK